MKQKIENLMDWQEMLAKNMNNIPNLIDEGLSEKEYVDPDKIREKNVNTLYNLKMLGSFYLNGLLILRVPGGWIYDNKIFIPFNNEGQQENLKL